MKHIYSDRADTPWSLNAASIIMYKSSRKNAKCSNIINIVHLATNSSDGKVSDSRIVSQFVDVLDKVLAYSLSVNGHLELSVFGATYKASAYIDANKDMYHTTEKIPLRCDRKRYYSFEQVVNQVYYLFCMVYPYNMSHIGTDIYGNASVKHMINKYYEER